MGAVEMVTNSLKIEKTLVDPLEHKSTFISLTKDQDFRSKKRVVFNCIIYKIGDIAFRDLVINP
jgi:hypothetical protein